ncbi:MAG TPA: lipoyl(octanoyl) transferase LipB [Mariprofundaceae bacterium]|nr:lipoyl(octanoyl) transferase LipB [Mariprofundaceae bacterium]
MRGQAEAIAANDAEEVIWGCEHEPVYTTGQRGIDNRLHRLDAPLVQTDRGGETTFHGPGQVMLYPFVHLRRRGLGVRTYVHHLEQACIDLLQQEYGIDAERRCGLPGVWTESGKIAALGIRIRSGIAYHGMALNADVEMKWFNAIRPCGTTLPVTSLFKLTGRRIDTETLGRQLAAALNRQLA